MARTKEVVLDCDKHLDIQVGIFKKSKKYNALCIYGPGGHGKSTTAREILKLKTEQVFGGHITPVEIYKYLYEHRNKELIVFDDCDTFFAHKTITSIIKNALDDNASGTRKVSWRSPSFMIGDTPREFVFNSKVVFIVNSLPKLSEVMSAVLSRILLVEYKLDEEDLKDKVMAIARKQKSVRTAKKIITTLEERSLQLTNLREFFELHEAVNYQPKHLDYLITKKFEKQTIESVIKEGLENNVPDKKLRHQVVKKLAMCGERKYYQVKKKVVQEMGVSS